MKNNIYLSVVLSTYNDERYIKESVQSILDQTYPYFEFIIVNDGSTDKTPEIIRSFNDDRIKIIDKPNTGLIDSLNTGVKNAKYEWIARMDGDDVAEPTRFEEEVKVISGLVSVVTTQCTTIDGSGNVIGSSYFPSKKWLFDFCIKADFILPIVHPSVLFNKEKFLIKGGYDSLMLIAEDKDMWLKMKQIGEIILINKPLIRYREHGSNISVQKRSLSQHNSWIAFIKFYFEISRPLSSEEYNCISDFLNSSRIFKYAVQDHKTKMEYIFKWILKNVFVRTNWTLSQIMRKVKNNSII